MCLIAIEVAGDGLGGEGGVIWRRRFALPRRGAGFCGWVWAGVCLWAWVRSGAIGGRSGEQRRKGNFVGISRGRTLKGGWRLRAMNPDCVLWLRRRVGVDGAFAEVGRGDGMVSTNLREWAWARCP